MLRQFSKRVNQFPYRAMRYKGIKQFAQDENMPHNMLCECKACNLMRAFLAQHNPARLEPRTVGSKKQGNEREVIAILPAQVRLEKDKPAKGIKVTEQMLRRSRNGTAVIKWRGF